MTDGLRFGIHSGQQHTDFAGFELPFGGQSQFSRKAAVMRRNSVFAQPLAQVM